MPEPDPKPDPTPTPEPEPKPDPEPKKDETYNINVGGEDRTVSLDELKELATKSAGADARFAEAAEIRKSGEKGARIGALIDNLSGDAPSDADIKELAGLLGEDPGKFLQQIKDDETKATKTTPAASKVTKEDIAAVLGVDPAEVKAILQHSKDRHISDAQKELREISDKAVDKDDIIGKMIVGKKGGDSVLLAVKDMVAEDVLRKIQNGEPYGAELVATVVQSVRSRLTKLGIPNKPDEQPIVLGLGPGQGLPVEVQADEPIKRISAAEDTDDSNVVARYMQKAIKAVRERR